MWNPTSSTLFPFPCILNVQRNSRQTEVLRCQEPQKQGLSPERRCFGEGHPAGALEAVRPRRVGLTRGRPGHTPPAFPPDGGSLHLALGPVQSPAPHQNSLCSEDSAES